jgi:ubiquinone/menaquinone biosynthesis C-methylase UbiE
MTTDMPESDRPTGGSMPAGAVSGGSTDSTAIAGYYDDYSSWYDDERRYGYYELINDLEVEKIAPALGGGRALEIGCGTGLLLERTSRIASLAVGIDLSPGMAAVSAGKGLAVANASVTQLGFADDSFDVVYSCKVLPHVPDIAAALAEIRRVLVPGGRMFLEFYNPASLKNMTYRLRWRGRREEPVFVRFDNAETLRPVLPPGVTIRSVRGIRIFGPTRHFYTLPVLRQITSWLDRRFCDSAIGAKLGGYLLFELEDAARS